MIDQAAVPALIDAVQRYFDLMYDSDTSKYDQVFRPTAQLHSVAKGEVVMLTAQGFKELIESRPSPKSAGAPRQEEILMIDVASPEQAFVKVRVRINKIVFVDYLTYHRAGGEWLITAKGYHVESRIAA
jgi:hypothetical protein